MRSIDAWKASGCEVSIAGLGRSGVAAARLLSAHGVAVYASDAQAAYTPPEALPGVEFGDGGHDLARVARSAALVLSPGIPPDAAVARAARNAGVPVVAEAQLGLDSLEGVPYIAVTGTNGKTTTTALLEHLMRTAGRRAVAAGNIGTPLSAVALRDPLPEWLAVELSSFQLHDMTDLRPAVGILTNLAPDHLDRYASIDAYFADKARLFADATPASVWVVNADDAASRAMLRDTPGRQLTFSVIADSADAWFDRGRGRLVVCGADVGPRDAFPLLGDHNVANALAAALAVHASGIDPALIAAGLATFAALPHRMEPVREVDGVLWINDSKATNIASTMVAVEAMTRPYVLLLGGRHKGEPYTALAEPLRRHAVAVVAYGEATDEIVRDLADVVPLVQGGSFADVINRARALAAPGGAVLLSPACSSYDMFANYEERGATFRSIVGQW